MIKIYALFISIIFCASTAFAQVKIENSHTSTSVKRAPPKVILLMLHLSTNKIEALKKRDMSEDIPEVIAGDEEMNNSIMQDFATSFKFCPVYFFYDTCYDKAKEKRLDEITFYDYESLHKKKMIATNQFADYYLAEVGYPSPGKQLEVNNNIAESMVDRFAGDEDGTSSRNNGINLYDENFKPISGKLGFTDISLRLKGPILGAKKYVFEGAAKFDKRLHTYFDKVANDKE